MMTKQQLASRIWEMANTLRGSIKANNYKDYILGFLFYKFVSDKQEAFMTAEKITASDMNDESTVDYIRDRLGYVIRSGNLFSEWKSMGVKLESGKVIDALFAFERDTNDLYKGVFKGIFGVLTSGIPEMGKETGVRNKSVRAIVDVIGTIPASDANYDVLGYIYEFFIYKFATAAKDDGAFYTPHEVSRLISMIIADYIKTLNKTSVKVYDATSGSGSLLLTVGEALRPYIDPNKIHYYGQEKITETYHLTRMNLVMKGIPAQNITIRNADTLEEDWPYISEMNHNPLRIDAVVSNPPYSLKWNPEGKEQDDRFRKYGLAPTGKADYAFLLHCLYHIEDDGIMGIILPHGVLFRGDSEGEIRKNLCLGHNIETIIGLPENLFFATGISTIIMILKKHRQSDDILFIDASKNFTKGKNQNVLRDCDIRRIFDAVSARKDISNFAYLAKFDEIEKNDFNLNIPRYVSASEKSDEVDFAALMSGNIPSAELDKYDTYWTQFAGLRETLFERVDSEYEKSVNTANIKNTVDNYSAVKVFRDNFNSMLDNDLSQDMRNLLSLNDYSDIDIPSVKLEIERVVMQYTDRFYILDYYGIYQNLSDIWTVIESDLTDIKESGLDICRQSEPNMIMKKVKNDFIEIQNGLRGTILDFSLIGEKFFAVEYHDLEAQRSCIADLERDISTVFDDLDDDVKTTLGGDKPKAAEVKKMMKSASGDLKTKLTSISDKLDLIKTIKKKNDVTELDIQEKIVEKMKDLTDSEIRDILMTKWICPLCNNLSKLVDSNLVSWVANIKNICDKYERTIFDIDKDIKSKEKSLVDMSSELTGSDTDANALKALCTFLTK